MAETYVALNMRVVANGASPDGKRLRATLVVTPRKATGKTDVTLERWPEDIVTKFRKGVTPPIVASHGPQGGPFERLTVNPSFDAPMKDVGGPRELATLWQTSISQASPYAWADLSKSIDDSASGTRQPPADQLEANYPADAVSNASLSTNGALMTADHKPDDPIKIQAVVPNPQATYAVETEALRGARVIRKLYCGPYLYGDQPILDLDSDLSGVAGDENKAQIIEVYKKRFGDVAKANDPSRAASQDVFRRTDAALNNTPQPAAATPAQALAPVAQGIRLEGPQENQPDYTPRAGQVYGAWPQRTRSRLAQEGRISGQGMADDDSDAMSRIQSIYYTLTGDPLLSRLFGFAFDLSFPVPEHLAPGERVRLSAGEGEIWTEALFDIYAGRTRFWPAPRNFKDAGPTVPQNEQAHGVCWFDSAQHLTSIDVRGAVAEAPDAFDRGERHRTIGFTFLDGDAAARAARDLAVAKAQQKPFTDGDLGKIILCAEDLTRGRRLDVAVKRDGKWQWRSLMTRTVSYPALPSEAARRLAEVAGKYPRTATGRLLEETSFQRVSRALPVPDPTTSNFEAVVEEAYLSWDGSPLAALACRSDSNSTGTNPILPVARAYDLPGPKDRTPRPPPLRYGVDYLFGMRAAFLGGGGPTIEEAQALYASADHVLPYSPQAISPKRFRRHESIAAPVLLLPASLVENRAGAMGFEPPADAILRTATPGDPEDKKTPEKDPPGPPYVEAAKRATGTVTWRVLAAPMAGLDFCARHGVFDHLGTAPEILAGGLREVMFVREDVKDPKTGKISRHAGFPTAVVTRIEGFNAERDIYQRRLGGLSLTQDAGEAFGATVIKSAPRDDRDPGLGYLPDPAAATVSLRARVSDCDLYLDGDMLVNLYDPAHGASYPNAMPVVLKIKKGATPRKALARKASEIFSDQGLQRFKFTDSDVIPSPSGTLARLVQITLAPGEQFDIEATCLPSIKDLAGLFSLPETIGIQLAAAKADPATSKALEGCCGSAPLDALIDAVEVFELGACVGVANCPAPADQALIDIAKRVIECVRNSWPLTEIAGVTSFHVAHALSAPLGAPVLKDIEIARKDPQNEDLVSRDKANPSGPLRFDSDPGAVHMIVTGEILVDLEQIDAFEIKAFAVAPGGREIDDPKRGRGVLAKRAGRWPMMPTSPTTLKPTPKRTVLGFDVDDRGKTTLPQEVVTLLRVHNLPDPRDALHPLERATQSPPAPDCQAPSNDPPIFLGSVGRLTRIDVGALFRMAILGRTVQVPIATEGTPKVPLRPRSLSLTRPNEISDNRARLLMFEARGISRFASAFQTAPLYSDEKGKTERLLARRQPLRARDQRRSAKLDPPVKMAATVPPCTPLAETPEIYFRIERFAFAEDKTVVQNFTRKSGVRLRFKRKWFASGEGERVGIVLWPPNYREQTELDKNWVRFMSGGIERRVQLNDLTDADLGDGGVYITRWGGDPIREDICSQHGWFIPPSAFGCLDATDVDEYLWPQGGPPRPHDPAYVPSVWMPVKGSSDDGGQMEKEPVTWMEISLLTFEPYFDIDAEEWFVDVPVSPSNAADPFVRFGLVRYQENALPLTSDDPRKRRLQVSTPVRVWTQLPPRREVHVHGRTEDGTIYVTATVCGGASKGAKDLPDKVPDLLKQRLKHSRMKLSIVHERVDAFGVRRQVQLETADSTDGPEPKVVGENLEWALNAKLEADGLSKLQDGQLLAWIEEVEDRLPATYPGEPKTFDEAFSPDAIATSGPRFAARIPFQRLGGAPPNVE